VALVNITKRTRKKPRLSERIERVWHSVDIWPRNGAVYSFNPESTSSAGGRARMGPWH